MAVSNFVLGNAQSVQDYPIVYCSDGFCQLTGFTRSEVMRKSCCCKFLFGIETEKDVISKLTQALQSQTEMKEEVLLYKKNGMSNFFLQRMILVGVRKHSVHQ